MNEKILIASVVLGLLSACGADDQKEAVHAQQDGVAEGADGVGVVAPVGFDLPDGSLSRDDLAILIRSYAPAACEALGAVDPLSEAAGFEWQVFALVDAAKLSAGSTFEIDGDDVAFSESVGGQNGDAGPWRAGAVRCGDETFDERPVGVIVAVEEDSMVIEMQELCFVDYGPLEANLSDDPSDDVVYDASGRYRVAFCGAEQVEP